MSQIGESALLQLPHFVFIRLTPQLLTVMPILASQFSISGGIRALRFARYQASSILHACTGWFLGRLKLKMSYSLSAHL